MASLHRKIEQGMRFNRVASTHLLLAESGEGLRDAAESNQNLEFYTKI